MTTKKDIGTHKAEVRIAVTNVASELAFECPISPAEIRQAIAQALSTGAPLILSDVKGREIIVPAEKIGYVEIGAQSERRVGFGTD
ncbi:MAG: DUF3107 domain-containing protein [Actinomycetota bacterium]